MQSTVRAIRRRLAEAVSARTDRLPAFRRDFWSRNRRRRWTLACGYGYPTQPSFSAVRVWGLGSLTLVRITV